MKLAQGMIGRILVVRLDQNEDLLEGIEKACKEVGIKRGIVYGIGSLKKARVTTRLSNNESEVIEISTKDKEIINISSLMGIISTEKDGIHLNIYLTLSKADGTVISGRALSGNLVNPSTELVILEIQKIKLERVTKEGYKILMPYE